MKAKNLKKEIIHTLETVCKYIKDDRAPDYDVSSLKYLLDEVVEYYSLYLKKEEQYKDIPREEQKYQRKYEDGLRVSIREYLDEY